MNRLFIAPIFALLVAAGFGALSPQVDIHIPLVIGGAAFLSRCEETLRAWLPQAKTYCVPDASHAMLQMNPRAVAERLHRSL